MACFCMHWPCMHTKDESIDDYVSSLRAQQACSEMVDEGWLTLKREQLVAYRNERAVQQNPYYWPERRDVYQHVRDQSQKKKP